MMNIKNMLAFPGLAEAVHNVKLLDVRQGTDGYELLIIEHGFTTHELIGGGQWNQDRSGYNVGKFGYLVPAQSFGRELPIGACYFRDYIDQSLRRVPELDSSGGNSSNDGRSPELVGWCCDAKPHGFRAPVGIIPGESGRFVPDETIAVTLRVPPEFVRECKRVQMTPDELLHSFVGDLAGIRNYATCPRADRYGSNGSDEREHAEAWLRRAHFMNEIDLDELDSIEEEAQEKQEQREYLIDLLDAFESHGGKAEEVFTAIQSMVVKKSAEEGSN